MKTIHFSSEEMKSVESIGEFLVLIGEKLKSEGFFTLKQGEQELKIAPTGVTKLELKYQSKGEEKYEFEIEIEWKPGPPPVSVE